MKNTTLISLFFLVYTISLLNLVFIETYSYPVLYVIIKYTVFAFFLFIFFSRVSKNNIVLKISTIDWLLIIFFLYNLFQSIILDADYKGAFKIFFGLLFVILLRSRTQDKTSIIHFYKIFNAMFLILIIAYVYFFLQNPFVLSYRLVRMDIGGLNGNEIAGIFTTTFPFSLLLIQNKFIKRKNFQTTTILFLVFYLYILIFYNGSRFAIFSSLLSAIILYYNTIVNKSELSKKTNFVKVSLVFLFFGFVSIYFGEIFLGKDEVFSKNISEVFSGQNQQGNLAGRIGGIWVPLIKYVNENSFFLGFGNESANSIAAKTTFWFNENNNYIQYQRDIHNFFITLYVESGAIGLSIFAWIYVIIFTRLILVLKQETTNFDRDEKIAVLCSFIGFTTWLLTANAWYSGGWFILFFYVYFLNQIETSNNLIKVNK